MSSLKLDPQNRHDELEVVAAGWPGDSSERDLGSVEDKKKNREHTQCECNSMPPGTPRSGEKTSDFKLRFGRC